MAGNFRGVLIWQFLCHSPKLNLQIHSLCTCSMTHAQQFAKLYFTKFDPSKITRSIKTLYHVSCELVSIKLYTIHWHRLKCIILTVSCCHLDHNTEHRYVWIQKAFPANNPGPKPYVLLFVIYFCQYPKKYKIHCNKLYSYSHNFSKFLPNSKRILKVTIIINYTIFEITNIFATVAILDLCTFNLKKPPQTNNMLQITILHYLYEWWSY